ncbi:uncharacterized protein LOC109201360 [Oreochromis niloticus]|uniref:uncharacterized protein LOC109201360 n=1 Tax=Oreochromis niloticus TaxID=8128 RepID=UPI000905C70A|nr:uncharacterized protein LOC109201360 [Oreochromis niloticus]CAI5671407.1 unnamed protein product [Mustela putorius furo]
MSAVTASLCSTLLLVNLCMFTSADRKIITAESGQDVTLICRVTNNNIIGAVKWTRPGLETGNVLLYHDDYFDSSNQHPSFKNRVDLQDRQMKDGDVSLILKHVTINDTGTYECRVFMEETRSWELIRIIYLRVVPPGQPRGVTEDGGKKEEGKKEGGKKDESVGLNNLLFLVVSAVPVVVSGSITVVVGIIFLPVFMMCKYCNDKGSYKVPERDYI